MDEVYRRELARGVGAAAAGANPLGTVESAGPGEDLRSFPVRCGHSAAGVPEIAEVSVADGDDDARGSPQMGLQPSE
jgi:hypothetical protein